MKIALSVKNKLGFIGGSILKPPESDLNLTNVWMRNNNIVISWLLNSVSKDISASVLFAESAADLWNDFGIFSTEQCSPNISTSKGLESLCVKTKIRLVYILLSSRPFGRT